MCGTRVRIADILGTLKVARVIFGLLQLWTLVVKLGAIAVGLVGGFANLAIRRPAAQPA